MDVRRRIKTNKLHLDIKSAELFISRSEESIKRIRSSETMGELFIKTQIDKMKTAINEKKEILEKLQNELSLVESGEHDEEINKEYNNEKAKQQTIQNDREKISEFTKLKNKENKKISESYSKKIVSDNRLNRQTDRDMDYFYRTFQSICSTIPDYIKTSLATMPSNSGYIWRGVWCFGALEKQNGPLVMVENQRGGTKIIHEYTETLYNLYEKKGKERKQLIDSKPICVKKTGTNLMDYLKTVKKPV